MLDPKVDASSDSPLARSERLMVLLVDDQPMVGESVRRALAGESDIDFHYCSDPTQASSIAQQLAPTVILQDLVMPGVDGLTLVRDYRAQAVTRNTPVIVLSTREEPKTKSEAFAAGANDYLVKLPDRLELTARLRYHSRAYLNQLQRDEAYRALRHSQQQLLETNIELQRLTNMDGLTGLNNRRRLDEYASTEWQRAARNAETFSLILCDVDYFKLYNDTYGHLVGDDALKRIATVLSHCSRRPSDLAARFGGEEFAFVLPGTSPEGTYHFAENVRHSVAALQIQHSKAPGVQCVTLSAGCATTVPERGTALIDFIVKVDSALYEAKRLGRNRTVMV